MISSPEVVVRTELQHRLGGYRPELPAAGDLEMWLRFAAHADVGYVKGADQAYYRVHPTSMQRTTYRSPLVMLEQHKQMFDLLFAEQGEVIADRDRVAGLAYRRLAREALWKAVRAYDRGRVGSTPVAELVDLAVRSYPGATRLPEYWGLRWRRAVGPRLCPYLQPLVWTAVVRKVRTRMWWRSWQRNGV